MKLNDTLANRIRLDLKFETRVFWSFPSRCPTKHLSHLPIADRIDPLQDLLCHCAPHTPVIVMLSKLCAWVVQATIIRSLFLLWTKLVARLTFQAQALRFLTNLCLHWQTHIHLPLELCILCLVTLRVIRAFTTTFCRILIIPVHRQLCLITLH